MSVIFYLNPVEVSDYTRTSNSFVLSGMSSISVSVLITNDAILEGEENFLASLSAGINFPSNVILQPITATATIVDEDSKYNEFN